MSSDTTFRFDNSERRSITDHPLWKRIMENYPAFKERSTDWWNGPIPLTVLPEDPNKPVPDLGRKLLRDLMMLTGNTSDFSLDDCFFADVGDVLVTKKGKIIKRLSRWARKNVPGYVESSDVLGKLGGQLNQYIESRKEQYLVGLAFYPNWQKSEYPFGNPSSCWWGDYADSRSTLWWNGGGGILLWDTDYKHMTVGRCWMMPLTDNTIGLFNAYGENRRTYARILMTLLGVNNPVNTIDLAMSTDMYVNNSTFEVVTTDTDDPAYKADEIRLRTENVSIGDADMDDGNTVECENCGCDIDSDDARYTEWGGPYCSDCAWYCEQCGECDTGDSYTVYRRPGGWSDEWCESCVENRAFQCEDCNDLFRDDSRYCVTVEPDGRTICTGCYEDGYSTCCACGEVWSNDRITEDAEGDSYCPGCADRHLTMCLVCDKLYNGDCQEHHTEDTNE